ncbi:MAG: tetratricopeptide repeat protein [Fibrobacter sp.]|nr:tetratricopeptide repeat protein [Fibrobacter sp.]
MTIARVIRGICIIAGATTLMVGCAPKARKAGGHMDDPPTHCKQGMKYWDQGKYAQAEEEFNQALSLDAKYAPAHSGIALVTAKKAQDASDKENTEKLFKEAVKSADKAVELNPKLPEVFIAKAIVLTMKYEGTPVKEWLDDVEKEYNKALKIDPENSEAYYRRGYCYKKAFEFSKAAADFKKVIELKKSFTIEANEQWELVQRIERAAPGTDVGKKIALVEKISRADIAALFVSELKIDKLVSKKAPKNYNTDFSAPGDPRQMEVDKVVSMAAVTDIGNHWAKNFINDIVDLNLRGLEPYPDHTFQPDKLITRGEYAMIVEDVLIAITGDQGLATKHIGTESRFPDVNPSNPMYNAICNAVDKGVMDAAMNGEFKPVDSVSGPDALLVIRKLIDFNKIE